MSLPSSSSPAQALKRSIASRADGAECVFALGWLECVQQNTPTYAGVRLFSYDNPSDVALRRRRGEDLIGLLPVRVQAKEAARVMGASSSRSARKESGYAA